MSKSEPREQQQGAHAYMDGPNSLSFSASIRSGALRLNFEDQAYFVLTMNIPANKVSLDDLKGKLSKDKLVDVCISWDAWQPEMAFDAPAEKPKRQRREKPEATVELYGATNPEIGQLVTCGLFKDAHRCTADCESPRLLIEADEVFAAAEQETTGALTLCDNLPLPHLDKPGVCKNSIPWSYEALQAADAEHERQVRISAEAAKLSADLDSLEQREAEREASMPGGDIVVPCCSECLKPKHDGPCEVEADAPVPTQRQRKRAAAVSQPAAPDTGPFLQPHVQADALCTCGDLGRVHYRTIGDTKNGITQDGCMRDGCGCLRFELAEVQQQPSKNGHKPESCAHCGHSDRRHTSGLSGACREDGCGCVRFYELAIDAPAPAGVA